MAEEPVNLNSLQIGEQAEVLVRCEARSGQQMTLGLHDSRTRARWGAFTVQKATAPFTIAGSFDTVPAGETPETFKVRQQVFLVAVGDEVVTTDGVHYVVVVVGSDAPGAQLPEGVWSPASNLRPQFRLDDIAENLGQT